jgi:hypothetical protein
MKLLKKVAGFVGIGACLWASVAVADTARITAFVTKTMVTGDSENGGCMAGLSTDPSNSLPACGRWWVSFSCDGTYTEPVRALRMLDQAQLALATGMRVRVEVTDSKMHDGFCVASEISLLSE